MAAPEKKKLNLPLLLTLGGMIILGITTTTLGFLLWPDPKPHHDESTEGLDKKIEGRPDYSIGRTLRKQAEHAPTPERAEHATDAGPMSPERAAPADTPE